MRGPPGRFTAGSWMGLVLVVAVLLAVARYVLDGRAVWDMDRVLTLHVVAVAVVIPLATAAGGHWYAAGMPDQAGRQSLALAVGCGAWALALGSFLFWMIVMLIRGPGL